MAKWERRKWKLFIIFGGLENIHLLICIVCILQFSFVSFFIFYFFFLCWSFLDGSFGKYRELEEKLKAKWWMNIIAPILELKRYWCKNQSRVQTQRTVEIGWWWWIWAHDHHIPHHHHPFHVVTWWWAVQRYHWKPLNFSQSHPSTPNKTVLNFKEKTTNTKEILQVFHSCITVWCVKG